MIGFFDVKNGCAGDMISAALAGCVDIREIKKQLEKIRFPSKYEIEIIQSVKPASKFHGIRANQFLVHVEESEHERSYTEILSIFEGSKLPKKTKQKIIQIFNLIAESESKVHGVSLDNLHFHAVGQTDALVEVSFSVLALEILGVERVFCTPVGIANAAPATLEMIKGIPVIVHDLPYEATTPTGAAIIRGLTESWCDIPVFIPEGYSYGTGTVETETANTVQFIYGKETSPQGDVVYVIETSVDDMNPVIFEYLMEKLYRAGALEVCFFTGITKKSRPIFWLRVLCHQSVRDSILEIIFRETTTLGIRYRQENRVILRRSEKKVKTKYGDIMVKLGYLSKTGQITNIMPEYEDCRRIAFQKKVPLKQVMEEAVRIVATKVEKNKL